MARTAATKTVQPKGGVKIRARIENIVSQIACLRK
jgi:hypothetical protein